MFAFVLLMSATVMIPPALGGQTSLLENQLLRVLQRNLKPRCKDSLRPHRGCTLIGGAMG